MQAKITRVKNNILFDYKFLCPIDKRHVYFNEGDTGVCFGACKKFMGETDKVIPVTINLNTMTVNESK